MNRLQNFIFDGKTLTENVDGKNNFADAMVNFVIGGGYTTKRKE